jgi:hypothetical protein
MTETLTVVEFKNSLKKKPMRSEHDLQAACIKWFKLSYPHYQMRLFAIPNAQKRDVKTDKKGNYYVPSASKQIAEGLVKGVWDAFLAIPHQLYGGMFIEFKVGRNKLTEDQARFQAAIGVFYKFVICYSFEDFKKAVDEYLNRNSNVKR